MTTPTPHEALREEFIEKFPQMLEVQLHGFGCEVDEIFDWFLSKRSKELSELKAKIKQMEWITSEEDIHAMFVRKSDILSLFNDKGV